MFEIRMGQGVVRLFGRLDASWADEAMETLKAVEGPTTMDLAGLEYISSAGIGVLVETFKRLRGGGHTLRLVNLSPRVRNVFNYAGLDRVLVIE